MAKRPLIEIDEEFGIVYPIQHGNKMEKEEAVYDLFRYDRDTLDLPPVFVFREAESNQSSYIAVVLDRVSNDVFRPYEPEEIICFHETREFGLQRVIHYMSREDPEQKFIDKTPARYEDIDNELKDRADGLHTRTLWGRCEMELYRKKNSL